MFVLLCVVNVYRGLSLSCLVPFLMLLVLTTEVKDVKVKECVEKRESADAKDGEEVSAKDGESASRSGDHSHQMIFFLY